MRLALLTLMACTSPTSPADAGLSLSAMTFNTGTTEGLAHDAAPDDGYTSAEATISDTWYGDGLAWNPVVDDAVAYFATTRPDIVAFQEIFYSGDCPSIPVEHHAGWVCEYWTEGAPTVAEQILGPDYQIACHLGKPDKCLAVRLDVGGFVGCDTSLCLDHLDGASVPDCGSGSRVGRGQIELAQGDILTVVSVHGSSGLTPDDRSCRVAQMEQVFVDLDGEPAANGDVNLVLGDFNTDPGRNADFDPSAAALNELAEAGGFTFATEVGPDAEPTYAGLFNIDHVLSDGLSGDCVADADISPVRYFDHVPVHCALSAP